MVTAQEIAIFAYNITLIPIIFFSVLFLIVAILNILFEEEEHYPEKKYKKYPFISVQVPVFNDIIAERCIKACLDFDYPKNRYELIIADDSTDMKVSAALKKLANKHKSRIKYFHRKDRSGFKPGALKAIMHKIKGDFIVIFDSDWVPQRNFLKKVLGPFKDPKVAIVQTRQGFINHETNLITRFAAYLLIIYHTIFMPINNRVNSVFFCGTAGAIRRSAFEDVGGWNTDSITEDSDLSVRLLAKGYRTAYLSIETPSEVPWTVEGFLRQQMRWCYGNTRVFFDHTKQIIFGKKINLPQKVMISFITLGNITAPIVILMTIFGFVGWFLGDPQLMNISDIIDFFSKFIYTSGFLLMGLIAFYKQRMLKEFPYLILSALSLSLVLAIANTIAFSKAVFNQGSYWYCTPKSVKK